MLKILNGFQLRNVVEVDQSSVLPMQTPRYETVSVLSQRDVEIIPERDDTSLLECLRAAAEAQNRQDFAVLVDAANLLVISPETLVLAVKMALNQEWLTIALDLVRRGAILFPTDETIQRIGRTLAPPVVRAISGEPPQGLAASRAWLRAHAGGYHGQWVAVYNGQLLAAAPTLEDLRARIDPLDHPTSTMITRVL